MLDYGLTVIYLILTAMTYTLENFDTILNLPLDKFEERLRTERNLTQITAEENKTLLHHLMKKNNEVLQCNEKANLLIQYGSNLKAVDDFGRTPLHTGLQYKIQPPVLESLINAAKKQNFNFNQKDNNGNTLLIISISVPYRYTSLGWAMVVDTHTSRLLEIDEIDPNLTNNASLSPLFLALTNSLTTEVIKLVESGAEPEKMYTTKLTDGSSAMISIIQHITNNIEKYKQSGDTKAASDLLELKDKIIRTRLLFLAKIRSRLLSLVEDKLKEYEESRKGFFRTSADSQRVESIAQIRQQISTIQKEKLKPILKFTSEEAEKELEKVKSGTSAFVEKLYQWARSAEAHHKEHGTFSFLRGDLTKSGLARILDQIIDSPLTKGIEFSKCESGQLFSQLANKHHDVKKILNQYDKDVSTFNLNYYIEPADIKKLRDITTRFETKNEFHEFMAYKELIELFLDGTHPLIVTLKNNLPDGFLAICQCLRDNQLLTTYNCKRLFKKSDEHEFLPIFHLVLTGLSTSNNLNQATLNRFFLEKNKFSSILSVFRNLFALNANAAGMKETLINKFLFLLKEDEKTLIRIQNCIEKYKSDELFNLFQGTFPQENFLSWLNTAIVLSNKIYEFPKAKRDIDNEDEEYKENYEFRKKTPSVINVAEALRDSQLKETYHRIILDHAHPSQLAVALFELKTLKTENAEGYFTAENIEKLAKHPNPIAITTWLLILDKQSALSDEAVRLVFDYAHTRAFTSWPTFYDVRGWAEKLIKTLKKHGLLLGNLQRLLTSSEKEIDKIDDILGFAKHNGFPIDQNLLDEIIAIKRGHYCGWGLEDGIKILTSSNLAKTTSNFLKILRDSIHWSHGNIGRNIEERGVFFTLYYGAFNKNNIPLTQRVFDTLHQLADTIKDVLQLGSVISKHINEIINNTFTFESFVIDNPKTGLIAQQNEDKQDKLPYRGFNGCWEARKVFCKAELAADNCKKLSQSFFSLGMKHKSQAINQALHRVAQVSQEKVFEDPDDVLDFKDGTMQMSLREALNINRLIKRKITSTLSSVIGAEETCSQKP